MAPVAVIESVEEAVRVGRAMAPVWLIAIAPVGDVIVPNVFTAVVSERPLTAEASSVPPVVISPVPEMACGEVRVTVPVPVVTGPSIPMPPAPV